jgi:2-polyprenyl-6-methoxyphenol hydroxylase-like FAD-dependent oxidoreductase
MTRAQGSCSGASIAGPAVAYWLARGGFEVTVVERAPAPPAGGQAIDIRGPALTVMRAEAADCPVSTRSGTITRCRVAKCSITGRTSCR